MFSYTLKHMQIASENGIYLPGPDLWIDPHIARRHAVVSHAHSDHMRHHERAVATVATAAMMKLRGAIRCTYETQPFGQVWHHNDASLMLVPAGHVLGSAQVLVEWQGVRLLYSGDFKLRPSLSSEPIEVPQADIVIMETTFGKPEYSFPPNDVVMDDIKSFCRSTLRAGNAPVLFCYSLGKGQEVLAGLEGLEYPIYLHTAHYKMARLYQEHGVKMPLFELYRIGEKLDGVLLCASGCRRGKWFGQLGNIRTAYISGWAAHPGARWRFGTDAAFPLSDHADYQDLLEYARQTGAGRFYTMHGFSHEFAESLREHGYASQALREARWQLRPRRTPRPAKPEAPRQQLSLF